MRQITRGDWEAFFALGLDVLLVFILMQGFCLGFLGFSRNGCS